MAKKKWEMTPKEAAEAGAEKAGSANVVENTQEIRVPKEEIPKMKREQRAALELMLSKLNCRHCNSTGDWKIIKTMETVRYVQCGVCKRTSAIHSKGPVTKTLRPSDLKEIEKKQT